MIKPKTLDEITRRLLDALPEGLGQLPEEINSNLRSALSAALAKADLVTREEFDVQTAVLARTREKLDALERQVKRLEGEPGKTSEPEATRLD